MEIIYEVKTHEQNSSHDLRIVRLNGVTIFITYESHNAYEKYYGEIFNGEKRNHLFNMYDLGVESDSTSYIFSPERRLKKSDDLFEKAKTFISKIL